MYRFIQLFKRDFMNMAVNPMWIFYSTAFPFLLVVILGFLSSGAYGSSVTSYDYYGITIMIYMIFNTSTLAANSFMEERIKKGNMRIIFSPLPKSFIYLSKIAATFVFSSICHLVVVLLLNLLLKVNFGGVNTLYIILIFLQFELYSCVLGILFCCIFKSENVSNQILSLVITISSVLGGLFFRLDGFGKAVERITCLSPVKWIVTGIFKIIYDKDFSYYVPGMIFLIGLSAAALLLCKILYRTEDYI